MSTHDIESISGGTVVDSTGDKVGNVGQVYLDDSTGEPSFVTVKTGFFGTNETFVPLRGADVSDGEIRVPYTKDVIKDAPNISADGHLDPSEEDEVHRYYQMGESTRAGDVRSDDRVGAVGGVGAAGGREGLTDDRDRDLADRDRDLADRDLRADRDTRAGDESVTLHEERVDVGTERVETGRVRLRKHVVTDSKVVEVPVEREEVEVVREPIADGARGGTLTDDEVDVSLHEDRPVVEKDVVESERVGLRTHAVQDTEQVQVDVGREELDVQQDGVDRSSWTDADYEREGYRRDDDGGWLDKLGNKIGRDDGRPRS